jgi:outer membrane protein TolC
VVRVLRRASWTRWLGCWWMLVSSAVMAAPPAPAADPAQTPPPAAEVKVDEQAAPPRSAAAEQSEAIDEPARTPRSSRASVYTLSRCLKLAAANYPKIHEARAKLANKRAQRSQAHTQPFSDWTFTAGLTTAPTVQGTAIYSPDSDVPIKSDMGLAWQVGLEGVIPLWTFGKITNTWDAADAQVTLGEHELKKEKNEVLLAVRRAYYGALLAHDARLLIREAEARIDKYLGPMQKKVADGDGDEIDLIKLQIYREDMTVRESEAEKQERIALAGLRFLTGVNGPLELPDLPLKRVEHRLGPLARYLSAARIHRPEINMARAGILARAAQARVARARLFPDIGLGLGARYANAPKVTDQRNPFVVDPGHGQSYGAALVLRHKFDFLPQSARLAQAQADLEEIRATERYALGGVGVEVEQAFREATDAELRLGAYGRSVALARRWLVQVQQGIDVGTFDDQEIVDPAKEYALKRFAQMTAMFDYNVALARLALATGWDAIAAAD